MVNKKVFIDTLKQPTPPAIDKKRTLIENQKVSPKKKSIRKIHTRKGGTEKVKSERSIIRNTGKILGEGGKATELLPEVLRIKKCTLLILGITTFIFLSSLPLAFRFQSLVWQKNRQVHHEQEVLYNRFLVEGLGENNWEDKTSIGKLVSIPTIRLKDYTVRKGDSLFGIANKFNVSVDSIITANNLKNAYYLQIGTELQIPNMSGIFYRVKKGDSLFSISRKYDANVNKVADINDLPSSLITVGQRIFIPGASLTAWQRAEAIGNIFENPTQGRIASRMGFRKDPFTRRIAYHAGVDIANTVGTRVCAAQFGRVIFTGYKGDYGKAVVIAHPQEYTTLYAHLDKITVRRGQSVSRGETIGRMGNTGRSTGPHLHFEVHQHNKLIDPLKMVRMR